MLKDQNHVRFRVLSSTYDKWYIKYPGFNSLKNIGDKGENACFRAGLGKVLDSNCGEYRIGDLIVFAGFGEYGVDEYTAAKNNIAKVSGERNALPEEFGIIIQMVYAISLLAPGAGMNFYVSPEIDKVELLEKVINKFGCNASTVADASRKFDGAILLNNSCSELKLTADAKTVYLSEISEGVCCTSLGQDFGIYKYMVEGCEVPRHYLRLTTAKNIETAYRLLESNSVQHNVSEQGVILPEDCVIQKIKAEYDEHINPGIMSVFVCGKYVEKIKDFCVGIAKYVSGSDIYKKTLRQAGNNIVITLRMENGTIIDCFALYSKKECIELELHFDRTSVVYKRELYQLYKGDKVFADKKKTPLTSDEIKFVAEFGRKNARE